MKTFIINLFTRDFENHEGVRPIQVYTIRLVFVLTLIFVGNSSWTLILNYEGQWEPFKAVAFSVWAAYSALSALGVWRPLRMLPIIAFQVTYKIIWLVIVALPLWSAGKLVGSDADDMTSAFLWVVLPLVAMPWGYFFKTMFAGSALNATQSGQRTVSAVKQASDRH